MALRQLFTSFDGRIGRREFWLGICLLAVAQAVNYLLVSIADAFVPERIYLGWSLIIWFLIGLWPALAIFAKRWHDRNKSAWWNLIAPPVVVPVAIIIALILRLGNNESALVWLLFLIVFGGPPIWLIVELGFLRGTKGLNQYGSNPLTGQASGDLASQLPSPTRLPNFAESGPVLRGINFAEKLWIISLFTSFEGRINRAKWWLGAVILLILSVVIMMIAVRLMGISMLSGMDPAAMGPAAMAAFYRSLALVQMIMLVILAYPATAVMKKRINDRDRPGWLVYVFWSPTVVGLALSLAGLEYTFVDEDGVSMPTTSGLYLVVGFAGLVIFIWALIELGILKGTEGINQHGPDPLAE